MQLKTTGHKVSNVMEPILCPDDDTIPPNDRTDISNKSQMYAEIAITGILRPSDVLNEESDVTFCAAIITLQEGTTGIPINNFTDQSYKLKKRSSLRKLFSQDTRAKEVRRTGGSSVHSALAKWKRGRRNILRQ